MAATESAEKHAAKASRTQGRLLHVTDSVLPLFKSFTVKDASNNATLYKARIHSSKPQLRLSSNGQEIASATYAGDDLEKCTTINMTGRSFEMRWDENGPTKDTNSEYWSSPSFAGTLLTWEATDMRTMTCCIQGDAARPVAILTRRLEIRTVADVEILDGWPAGDIDEIVMLALVSFYRFRRMLESSSLT